MTASIASLKRRRAATRGATPICVWHLREGRDQRDEVSRPGLQARSQGVESAIVPWIVRTDNRRISRAASVNCQVALISLKTLGCLDGFLDCYDGSKLKGVIAAPGIYEKGAIKGTKYLAQAYKLGLKV